MQQNSIAEWRKGWRVVLAAALGMAATILHVNSLGVLIQPIHQDTGWNRQQILMGFTICSFVSVLLQPAAGYLVDRFGVRLVASSGIALYGLSFVCLAHAGPDMTTWIASWVLLAAAFSVLLSVWVPGITGYFNESRGLAIAIAVMGTSLGGVIVPFITALLVKNFGWRGAYLGLSAYPLFIAFPVVALLFKDARFASNAVSAPNATRTSPAHGTPTGNAQSVHEIIRSQSFWRMALTGILTTTAIAGLVIHLVPIMVSFGSSQERAAALVAWLGVGAFAGPPLAGFLVDRADGRLVTVTFFVIALLSILMLMVGTSNAVYLSFVLLVMGLATGAQGTCVPYLAGKYFAGKNFGFAFSLLNAGMALGGGIGPLVGGILYDKFQTYWYFELAAAIATALSVLFLAGLARYPSQPDSVDLGDTGREGLETDALI